MSLFLTLGRMIRCLAVFLLLCLVVVGPAFCMDKHAANKDKRVSFEFRGHSMAEVASRISEQLNYRVSMDDELADMPVSGKFDNVTLEEFFSRRIFRGINVAILFDENTHTVIISVLGKKGSFTKYDNTTPSGTREGDQKNLEITPGVMMSDVVKSTLTDPMDMELTPGVIGSDVVKSSEPTDPMDMELTPGVIGSDVIKSSKPIDPMDMELTPGVFGSDVVKSSKPIDPMDMELTPGIFRRDVVKKNSQ